MRNRKIAIMLIFAMLMCIMPTNIINAAQNSTEKSNFHFFESPDLSNIHYTYEEAGKSYSVYETCNSDLSIIRTEIYLNDGNNQKLIEKFETHMNTINEVLYIQKYCDGKITESYSVDLASSSQMSNNNARCISGITYDGNVYYDGRTGKYYTGWYYSSTMIGSNLIPKLTLSATMAVVATILGVAS